MKQDVTLKANNICLFCLHRLAASHQTPRTFLKRARVHHAGTSQRSYTANGRHERLPGASVGAPAGSQSRAVDNGSLKESVSLGNHTTPQCNVPSNSLDRGYDERSPGPRVESSSNRRSASESKPAVPSPISNKRKQQRSDAKHNHSSQTMPQEKQPQVHRLGPSASHGGPAKTAARNSQDFGPEGSDTSMVARQKLQQPRSGQPSSEGTSSSIFQTRPGPTMLNTSDHSRFGEIGIRRVQIESPLIKHVEQSAHQAEANPSTLARRVVLNNINPADANVKSKIRKPLASAVSELFAYSGPVPSKAVSASSSDPFSMSATGFGLAAMPVTLVEIDMDYVEKAEARSGRPRARLTIPRFHDDMTDTSESDGIANTSVGDTREASVLARYELFGGLEGKDDSASQVDEPEPQYNAFTIDEDHSDVLPLALEPTDLASKPSGAVKQSRLNVDMLETDILAAADPSKSASLSAGLTSSSRHALNVGEEFLDEFSSSPTTQELTQPQNKAIEIISHGSDQAWPTGGNQINETERNYMEEPRQAQRGDSAVAMLNHLTSKSDLHDAPESSQNTLMSLSERRELRRRSMPALNNDVSAEPSDESIALDGSVIGPRSSSEPQSGTASRSVPLSSDGAAAFKATLRQMLASDQHKALRERLRRSPNRLYSTSARATASDSRTVGQGGFVIRRTPVRVRHDAGDDKQNHGESARQTRSSKASSPDTGLNVPRSQSHKRMSLPHVEQQPIQSHKASDTTESSNAKRGRASYVPLPFNTKTTTTLSEASSKGPKTLGFNPLGEQRSIGKHKWSNVKDGHESRSVEGRTNEESRTDNDTQPNERKHKWHNPEAQRFDKEVEESNALLSRLSQRFEASEGEASRPKPKDARPRKEKSSEATLRGYKRSTRLDANDAQDERRSAGRDIEGLDPEKDRRRAEKAAEQQRRHREKLAAAAAKRAADGKPITLPAYVTVSNLAQLVGAHYSHFANRLKTLGFDDIYPSRVLDAETASLIALEYGYNASQTAAETESTKRDLVPQPEADAADAEYWPIRSPVVTIMGHVDHGKTTILDFLRKANVAAGEAGGITQHIGAFSVTLPATRRTITFLDTPGHAAFLAMRQRGANVTDIVVLVVAADDSVMPQTLEALKHASNAQVPIIVAINKVDKPEADVQRVKLDLSRHGVELEDFGGDVQVVEVSGKTGRGMDALEEAIVTQAELLDRRADIDGDVDGWVIEATTKAAGRIATVLVRRGTLKVGSILVAGKTWTRVKVLRDDTGRELIEAGPGTPVEIDGWREQPAAGDRALQAEDERHAASVVDFRRELADREKLAEDTEIINKARREHQLARERAAAEDTAGATELEEKKSSGYIEKETGQQIIPVLIKADVSGSAEAVAAYISGLGSSLIAIKILQSLVGPISESDIEYAAAVRGLIIGFNVETEERIKSLAAARHVQILENNIIYRVVEDVKETLEEKLPPLITQKVTGEAEIAQSFEIDLGKSRKTTIAGCKVRNGVVSKNSRVRVMRDLQKVYDGTLSSLKNVKKDVTEMRKGSECGMGFADWMGFQPGDIVQSYEEISEKRRL